MAQDSAIQWTTHTFNPWIGCTKVSPGCEHCYAAVSPAALFNGVRWGLGQQRHRTTTSWKNPVRWNKTAMVAGKRVKVFCASLADWLDDEVPIEWLCDLLGLIAQCDHGPIAKIGGVDFQLLTKRPENWRTRMEAVAATTHYIDHDGRQAAREWLAGSPPRNVWIGTTVEDQRRADERIPLLLEIPSPVRFLSCEPLLGKVTLLPWLLSEHGRRHIGASPGLSWVIVGGESGPKARHFKVEWMRSLIGQCARAGVPVFCKQLGARPHENDRALAFTDAHAGDWAEWPEDLRVRQFPEAP